jgi:hypothetical protein
MGALPANARIFIADTMAMYTNIEPATGIAAVQAWLSDFEHELPKGFPARLVIQALEMVMTRNTFQFDDKFWQKFVRTSMGTPSACVDATVAYCYHERTSIIPKQNKEVMPYLKRFIEYMLGIWCRSDTEWEWEVSKASLNSFGRLELICSKRLTLVIFLNLTIEIDASSNEIKTETYQKPQNLHLYIPVMYAHPEACFQGTIMCSVICYWKQKSSIEDSGKLIAQFAERLCQRGHEAQKVT